MSPWPKKSRARSSSFQQKRFAECSILDRASTRRPQPQPQIELNAFETHLPAAMPSRFRREHEGSGLGSRAIPQWAGHESGASTSSDDDSLRYRRRAAHSAPAADWETRSSPRGVVGS